MFGELNYVIIISIYHNRTRICKNFKIHRENKIDHKQTGEITGYSPVNYGVQENKINIRNVNNGTREKSNH